MAGRPIRRAMVAELERIAAALSTPDEPITPLDYICDRTASGDTLSQIARDVGAGIGRPDFRVGTLSSWIHSTNEGKAKIAIARSVSADILAESAGEILDALAETEATREEVALAKARADYRQWLASKRNRETYGADTAQVNVAVSLPAMHLEALQVRAKTAPVLPPAGADYESPAESLPLSVPE